MTVHRPRGASSLFSHDSYRRREAWYRAGMRSLPGWIIASIVLAAACGDDGSNTTATESAGSTGDATTGAATEQPTTTGVPSCEPAGQIVCLDDMTAVMCGDDGVPGSPQSCTNGACIAGVGCPECQMGDKRCMGADIEQCGAMGTWEPLETCNDAQGLTCDEATKACAGACLPAELAKSGVTATGCEFYAVTSAQLVPDGAQLAVVIENPGGSDATITVTQDDGFMALTDTVPAGGVKAIRLPFVDKLLSGFIGQLVYTGAYKVESDQPVRAVQYSPIDVTASVDASLLWPRHAWGTSYMVASYGSTPVDANTIHRGLWSITGGDAETMVTVTAPAGTMSKAGPGIMTDGNGALKMNAGDILQIPTADVGDLTGTRIEGDKPLQVLGGHRCANVPQDKGYCDHLEDMMLPLAQLGTTHVLVPPVRQAPQDQRRVQVVRVIATDGATNLTYDPPQMGAPATIADTGQFVELAPSAELYALTSDKPVLVAQYMVGSLVDGDKADPSMLVTLPTDRFHTTHYVHTLADWLPLDIDITAPADATVMVDGMAPGGWVDVGGSGYKVTHVRLATDVGLIEITGDKPIAVNVYATRAALPSTSFWYSAGGSFAP